MEGLTRTTVGKGIALLRVVLGGGFLFAGLEKALDFAGTGKAFTAAGYLKFGTTGAWLGSDPKAVANPTHDFWVGLAGDPALVSMINFLVVFGEIAIGAALILGLATRFASYAGLLMMALFYVSNWSFANGPFNEQFMYGTVALVLGIIGAGEYYGVDAIVDRTELVRRIPALRLVLA